MPEAVTDPKYWRQRLVQVTKQGLPKHHAIFKCPTECWTQIEDRHQEILQQHMQPSTSVLDVGCGWGRLLSLMPSEWRGSYLGVDISPEFIGEARKTYPGREFRVCDLATQDLDLPTKMDLAVLVSVRPMLCRNMGQDYWFSFERTVKTVVDRILYLEYDVLDSGTMEIVSEKHS